MRQVVLLYRLDYATFELPSCWSPKHQRVFCTKHLSLTFVTCSCLCLCLAHHLWQKCLCFPLGPLNGFLVLFCLFLSFTLFFFFLVRGEKEGTCCLNIPVQCVQPPSPLHCDYFMCKFCKRSYSVLWHMLWSHCGVPGFGDKCSVEKNKHDCQIFPAPY